MGVLIPSDNFHQLETSEFLGSFNMVVDSGLVGKKIEVDLRGGDHWSIVHDLSLEIFPLLRFVYQTEVKDSVSFTAPHGSIGTILIPIFIIEGKTAVLNKTFGSGEVKEIDQIGSFGTGFDGLLGITRTESLRIEFESWLRSFLPIILHTKSVSNGGSTNDGIVGRTVSLVLDGSSTIWEFSSEVEGSWDDGMIFTSIKLTKFEAIGLDVVSIEKFYITSLASSRVQPSKKSLPPVLKR